MIQKKCLALWNLNDLSIQLALNFFLKKTMIHKVWRDISRPVENRKVQISLSGTYLCIFNIPTLKKSKLYNRSQRIPVIGISIHKCNKQDTNYGQLFRSKHCERLKYSIRKPSCSEQRLKANAKLKRTIHITSYRCKTIGASKLNLVPL